MKTVKFSDSGLLIQQLQDNLSKLKYSINLTETFDEQTKAAVIQFQKDQQLDADGIVGNKTWLALNHALENFSFFKGENYNLNKRDYFQQEHPKNTIYLHHTAGAGNPNAVCKWWESDNEGGKNRVATAFVVGRSDEESKVNDGKVVRAFHEKYWAHHLGLKTKHNNISIRQNTLLNQRSIGIEICSYGPLSEDEKGIYFQAKKRAKKQYIPAKDIVELEQPWRNHKYFHKYTKRQLSATKMLIFALTKTYDIPIPKTKYDANWFDLKWDALQGAPGIWTHCNVRYDKTDCSPQPELIDMLNSLHEDYQNFEMEDYDTFIKKLPKSRSASNGRIGKRDLKNAYTERL